MKLYESIGNNIRCIRKQRGMHHNEVAEAIGVTRASVVNIEKGRQRISIDKLLKLCELFGCNAMDILPSKDTYKPNLKPFRDHFDVGRNKSIDLILTKIETIKQDLTKLK